LFPEHKKWTNIFNFGLNKNIILKETAKFVLRKIVHLTKKGKR